MKDKKIETVYYTNILRGRIIYHNASGLFDFLESQKIPYAVIKGEALSILAYKQCGQRIYNDLDILISRKHVKDVSKYLVSQGFVNVFRGDNQLDQRSLEIFCLSNSHQMLPYVKSYRQYQIEIDLNFDIFWGEYNGLRIDIEKEFLLDTIKLDIYKVEIQSLNPIKAFIALCLHQYKDMNSIYILATQKVINHQKLRDIYNLLMNNIDELSFNRLYELCNKYRIIPYIYCVLSYVYVLCPDAQLNPYLVKFKSEQGDYLLNHYGLDHHERKPWRIDLLQRMDTDNLYNEIKKDLSIKDIDKIELNKAYF